MRGLDSMAQFFDKTPPLPETVSREGIYLSGSRLMAIASCLADTSILLQHDSRPSDSQHKVIAAALGRLAEQGTVLFYTHQTYRGTVEYDDASC